MSTPLVNWLRREIKHENTPIVVFCGRPRSGKTAGAMRFAWEVYPKKFTFKNVVSSIEDFARVFSETDHNIIILDEASDSLYVYDYNSLFQRVFSVINDTQAFKHNIVFIVLPMVHKLGKVHRYDVDAVVMMTKRRNYDTNKPEIYYKYQVQLKAYNDLKMMAPRVMTVVDSCGPIPLPPEHIWKPYIDEGQKKFKDEIMKRNLEKIFKKMNPEKPKERVPLSVLLRTPKAVKP